MRGARFEVLETTENSLVIQDIGPWGVYPSVTNDAENVVAKLHSDGSLGCRLLYYYDSEGQMDRILHQNGKFIGFAPGPGKD